MKPRNLAPSHHCGFDSSRYPGRINVLTCDIPVGGRDAKTRTPFVNATNPPRKTTARGTDAAATTNAVMMRRFCVIELCGDEISRKSLIGSTSYSLSVSWAEGSPAPASDSDLGCAKKEPLHGGSLLEQLRLLVPSPAPETGVGRLGLADTHLHACVFLLSTAVASTPLEHQSSNGGAAYVFPTIPHWLARRCVQRPSAPSISTGAIAGSIFYIP